MGEKIALGFHTCVDYELKWNTGVVEEQIKAFDIHEDELKIDVDVKTERDIWISCLAHLKEGIGGEMVPDTPKAVVDFAEHFEYAITLGGTATRAAIILAKLGYESVLQTSCYNEHVERLMPDKVHALPGVPADHTDIYPHVVLQCAKGVRICANDIDFVTPRENRVMVSRDIDSLNMPVLPEAFGSMIADAEVFLLGCFSEILDQAILEDCVEKTKALWKHLPEDALVVMEDGCYIKKDFRYLVHEKLAPMTDILSMNEDELQEYIGKRINILDVDEVMKAVKYVHETSGIKTILVHSAAWALAYGEKAGIMHNSLEGGIVMASTRFRVGDHFTDTDYEETRAMPGRPESVTFCERLKAELGDQVCCLPCKDLSHVEHPTVVGLGDTFAGGLLPGLLKENRA